MTVPPQHQETNPIFGPLGNEEGAALIIVMIMLLLLMILGATLLTSSTTELRIAGNYRNTEDAFYSADALVEILYTGFLPKNSVINGSKLGSDTPISDLVRPGGAPVQATYEVDNKKVTYTIGYSKQGTTRTLAGKGYDDTFTDVTSVYTMDVTGSDANDNASVDLEAAFALIEP